MMNLKPCPLCGSHAEPALVTEADYFGGLEFSIRCINKDCALILPAEGDVYDQCVIEIEQKYIDHWNGEGKNNDKQT